MMGLTQDSACSMPPQGPSITQSDWEAFFQEHFAHEAVAVFGQTFQNPAAFENSLGRDDAPPEEDEDGLGYYEDGVKRTLTDEQIEMFRQSELRDLCRRKEREASSKSLTNNGCDDTNDSPSDVSMMPSSSRASKKKKKKGAAKPRHEPKPDLRKRTWDVVEAGLDTLEYD